MKKVLICIFTATLIFTGCGKVPKLENGQEAVVTMKGENISVDTLYNELKEDYALNNLINMIDEQILTEIYPSDKSEETYIANEVETVKYYYENYYKTQYATYEEYLIQNGVKDEAQLKENISLSYKRNLETKEYAKKLITEKQIKKYYQDEIYGDITASHILVAPDTNENSSESEITAAETKALNEAKKIIAKLKNGEDFTKLAKEYSDDTSTKTSGGVLPAFNKGQMESEFEKAAVKLEKGKYTTTPVKTKYGYHIILKTSQKDKPSLEDVKDDIINDLVSEKMSDDKNIQVKALVELRKKYDVEIQDKTLKKQYDNYIKRILG